MTLPFPPIVISMTSMWSFQTVPLARGGMSSQGVDDGAMGHGYNGRYGLKSQWNRQTW